jgi:membrane-bound serine protease (ClpP class)
MSSRITRRLARAVVFLAGALSLNGPLSGQTSAPAAPVVYVADVDSVIHPVSAEYMIETLATADRSGAALVVFQLRTPGGLVDATRDIITHMIAAKTPVTVFVAPPGSRAASAGFLLTIAADVAAMAPGTHIGAAHPVQGGGDGISETMTKKAEEDVAAYVRTLAAARHRNVDLAVQAVRESKAFTETEARDASPPLIDWVAGNVPELLTKLDGRTIRRFNGDTTVLRTAGAQIVPIAMSLRQRILSAIAHPNIAYILLSLGMLGLTIELWSPGAILPGVVGGVALLLAFFSLQLLPVNYAGLLLLVLGLILLGLEIKMTSYGLLTAGGLVSLVLGSMILIDSESPELQVSLRVILPVVFGFAGISVALVRLAISAQSVQPSTGAAGMVGASATAITPLEPGIVGKVSAHGEIWQAEALEPVPAGARLRITGIEGLTLVVRKD